MRLSSRSLSSLVLNSLALTITLPHRLLYVQACGFMARTKYYGVWELTEVR